MNQNSKSDRYLTRLKVTLAAGSLIATMLGASLLGRPTDTSSVDTRLGNATDLTVTTNLEAVAGDELDLTLDAVPTVTAPTFRGAPLAFGRSSG